MLFELDTDRKVNRMKSTMKKVIETFEPRVKNVVVLFGEVERNEMDVTIFYNITDGVKNQDLTFTVTRAR